MSAEALSEADTYATWGDLFEVAVKRGCLYLLLDRGLLPDEPHLAPWAECQVADLIAHAHRQFGITDPPTRERYALAVQRLLLQGWALGWTVLRSALDRLAGGSSQVLGLYCPLSLPERPKVGQDPEAHRKLWQALRLAGEPDPAWLAKGQPAQADFLLWLRDGEDRAHVYVLEFSLNTQLAVRDRRDPEPHLDELLAHAQRLESRGIFTRIGASLTGDEFTFSDGIVSHLAALTTRDKPLYKLAQASAYASNFLANLRERGVAVVPTVAHAIAVTNSGVEVLEAEFSGQPNPRWSLMQALGDAYPCVRHPREDDRQALDREIEAVRDQIVRALPPSLRNAVYDSLEPTSPSRHLDLRLGEEVSGFVNPASAVAWERLAVGIKETAAVCDLLGTDRPRAHLAADLRAELEGKGRAWADLTMRDAHTAVLRRAITLAPSGRVTVVAAEGLPGIGKTYSIREALRSQPGGFLWFYASPRLVINEDVLREVARPAADGVPDVLAMTTNYRLVSGAKEWWAAQATNGRKRRVDGAVLCLGAPLAVVPQGSTLFVDEAQAHEIDARYAGTHLRKRHLDEDTDEVRQNPVNGVLATLAGAARQVVEENPAINRLALTASIQGFRYTGSDSRRRAHTTVERLSNLFCERAGIPAALAERRAFASRVPTIVVMVDEIAGDGAGAPFVHELGAWLQREFITPFVDAGETSPFRVVLVLADASLGNAEVMASYLAHEVKAPEKVIVSPSQGVLPLRVSTDDLRIGGRQYRALHVMADGYPAAKLRIDYHLQLSPINADAQALAEGVSARTLIQQQSGERLCNLAVQTIFDSLSTLPDDQQVIFFAQDKLLLRDLRAALLNPEDLPLVEPRGQRLSGQEVAILDSSVTDKERRRLVEPAVRDRQRVFLMTSSGARGISFPRAATIIGLVPRFAVESGFMELAQLVYRGRGGTGDFLDRRLVMIMQDFIVTTGCIDERQWLRRTLDLLSALLLLRATIFTRITGDAGLPHQRAAVVPVGCVGAEELISSLSHAVGPFLRECRLFLKAGADGDLAGLVRSAHDGVQDLFANLQQEAGLPKGRQSVMRWEWVDQLVIQATAEHARLLNREHPLSLPAHISATAQLWLESWEGLKVEERFAFGGQSAEETQRIGRLRGQLYRLGQEYRRLPRALAIAARDLESLLKRPSGLGEGAFRVKRDVAEAKLWVCVPLDYLSFCFFEGEHGRQVRCLDQEAQPYWHDGLLRVVAAEAPILALDPVIPRYREWPFLTFQTTGDPTGLERAFDGRYFMASAELNLLNTILFVEPNPA